MNLTDISNTRLLSQQIIKSSCKTAKDVVGNMGAIQAQDYNMAKWAVGLRLPGATEATIDKAMDKGEIIRTHILRPTWHLVSADDIYWMLELTAPRIKASMRSREKQLELTETVFRKSNKLIEKAVGGNKQLTRSELNSMFIKAKIPTDDSRSSHLLVRAELEGIICSGPAKGKQTTYALLSERVPVKKRKNKEEALAELALRYFTSHCPATLQDFTWWSGLSAADAKNALEMVRIELVSERIGEQTYWLPASFSIPKTRNKSTILLPAFDEYLISYKNRSAAIGSEHHRTAISINGIFWPIIVESGKVTGVWKRTTIKEKVIITPKYFQPRKASQTSKASLKRAATSYGKFLNRSVEVIFE